MATEEEMLQMMTELEAADARIKELEAELASTGGGGGGDDDFGGERVEALRAQNETLTDDLNNAKDRIRKLERENKNKDAKAKSEAEHAKESLNALNDANRRMEELKRLYAKERESSAKRDTTTHAMETKFDEMQVELKQTMEHNIELQSTIETMAKQIELVEEHVSQKDAQMDKLENDLAAQRDIASRHDDVIRNKNEEIQSKERELQDAMKLVKDTRDELSVIENRANANVEQERTRVRSLNQRLKDEMEKNVKLNADITALRDSSRMGVLEDEIKSLKSQLEDSTRKESELHSKFEDVTKEYLELAEKHVELDRDHSRLVEDAVEVALVNERKRIHDMEVTIRDKDEHIKEFKHRVEELESQKILMEEEMMGVKEYMQENKERGFESMYRDITQLKAALRNSENETSALANEYNLVKENLTRSMETNTRLKRKCGLSDDFEYEKLELDESVRKKVEQSKFVIQELKEQNRVLESERLRLLKKLMRQAELHNFDKDGRFANLSADEQDLVMRYVENLRRGVEKKPLNDRSWELNEKLKESESRVMQLEKANAHLEIRLETMLKEGGGGGGGRRRRQENDDEEEEKKKEKNAERTTEAIQEMKREVASMKRGDEELRESLLRELPKLVRESIAASAASRPRRDVSEDEITKENVELLQVQIEDLQDALKRSREEVESLRSISHEENKPPLHPKKNDSVEFSASQLDVEDNDIVGGVGDSLSTLPSRRTTNDEVEVEISSIEEKDTPMRRLSFSSSRSDDNVDGGGDNVKSTKEDMIRNAKQASTTSTDKTTAAAAAELLREWETALQLPPKHREAKWAVQMRELLKQLVSCLILLARRDNAMEESEDAISSLRSKIRDALHQRSLIYHQYAADMDVHRSEIEKFENIAREREEALTRSEIKAKRYDELMKSKDDEKSLARKLSREITQLELRHDVLRRKLRVLEASDRDSRETAKRAESDLEESTRTYRRRVLYLELWKRKSMFTMKKLVRAMSDVVPRSNHDVVVKRMQRLKNLYEAAVSRESKLHEISVSVAIAARKSVRLVAAAASETKEESKIVESVTKLCTQVVELKKMNHVSIDNEDKENNNNNNTELQTQIQNLKERLQSISLIAEENAAKAKKYKTLADIAATQAQSTNELNKVKKDAVLELRKQLHLKWTQSEEDVIIGKLQQELFTTKAAYRKFVRKYETVFVNLRKKELEVRRLEEESDQKDQLVLTLESKHAKEKATLHSALHKMFGCRDNNDNDDSDKYDDVNTIEKLRETIETMSKKIEEQEASIRDADEARREAEESLSSRTLSVETARAVRADIEALLAISSEDNDDRVQLKMCAKRLDAMNTELCDARLHSVKIEREVTTLRDENQFLKRTNERNAQRLSQLDSVVQSKEAELRRRRLKGVIPSLDSSKDGVMKHTFNIDEVLLKKTTERKDTTFPLGVLGDQNERLRTRLEQDEDRIDALRGEISRLERELREERKSVEDADHEISSLSSRVRVLEAQIREEGMTPVGSNSTNDDKNNNDSDYFENDSKRLQYAAQQTIASLQKVLRTKNRTVEKYREKIEDMQRTQDADVTRMQKEIERLTDRLYEENKQTIGNLKSAADELRRRPDAPEHALAEADVDASLIERVEEAEKLIREHQDSEAGLRVRLKEEEKLRENLERRILKQSKEIDELEADLDRAQEEIQKERENVEASRKPLERTTRRLKTATEAHEKEMQSMKSALHNLKDRIVKAEMEHAEKLEEQRVHLEQEREVAESENRKIVKELRKRLEVMQREVSSSSNVVVDDDDDATGQEDETKRSVTSPQRDASARQHLRRKLDEQRDLHRRQTLKLEKLRKHVERVEDKLKASLKREVKLRDALKITSKRKGDAKSRTVREVEDDAAEDVEDNRAKQDDGEEDDDLKSLKRRIRVLQAQNVALRGAAMEATGGRAAIQGEDDPKSSLKDWQERKKLQRRVNLLQRRLKDRTKELEKYRNERSGKMTELDRERSKHAAEIRAMKSKTERLKETYKKLIEDANQDDDRNEELTDRVYGLESKIAERDEANARMRNELETLRQRLDRAEKRSEELEDEVEAEQKLRLRVEEEHDEEEKRQVEEEGTFIREERLRSALSKARDEISELRQDEEEKRRKVLDLQFALESTRTELSRRKDRIERMEREIRVAKTRRDLLDDDDGDDVDTSTDTTRSNRRRPRSRKQGNENNLRERVAESQSRAKALESVIDRMKRAMTKQQQDLKRKSEALERHEILRRECQRLRRKLKEYSSGDDNKSVSSPPDPPKGMTTALERRQQAAAETSERTRLRAKLSRTEKRWRSAQSETESLRKELETRNTEIVRMKRQMKKGPAARTRINALERRDTELERKLSHANQELVTLRVSASNAEKLAKENAFLKKELSAFDAEFFEEIEDLKYNYARALDEIRELKRGRV